MAAPPDPQDRIKGANYDPYDLLEERKEQHDPISFIFSWSGKNGTYSTWRERHIGIEGAVAGLKAGSMENVPDCPPMWQDEAQYFDGTAMLFNVTKIAIGGAVTTLATLAAVLVTFQSLGIL